MHQSLRLNLSLVLCHEVRVSLLTCKVLLSLLDILLLLLVEPLLLPLLQTLLLLLHRFVCHVIVKLAGYVRVAGVVHRCLLGEMLERLLMLLVLLLLLQLLLLLLVLLLLSTS